jgi:hypothetical protein
MLFSRSQKGKLFSSRLRRVSTIEVFLSFRMAPFQQLLISEQKLKRQAIGETCDLDNVAVEDPDPNACMYHRPIVLSLHNLLAQAPGQIFFFNTRHIFEYLTSLGPAGLMFLVPFFFRKKKKKEQNHPVIAFESFFWGQPQTPWFRFAEV